MEENTSKLIEEIKAELAKQEFAYLDINAKDVSKIHKIVVGNDISSIKKIDNKLSGTILYYMAVYYYYNDEFSKTVDCLMRSTYKGIVQSMWFLGDFHNKRSEYDLMKKYYLMAIDKGHTNSMYNLAIYYRDVEKDYDQMKKYYLMAIDKGNMAATNQMANYYFDKKKYDKMKKYYMIGVDNGDINSMYYLGNHYQFSPADGNQEENYNLMKKYYLMAISKGNDIAAMYNLGMYYGSIGDYGNMEKNYQMALDSGATCDLKHLYDECKKPVNKKYYMEVLYIICLNKDWKLVNAMLLDIYDGKVPLTNSFNLCLSMLKQNPILNEVPPLMKLLIDSYNQKDIQSKLNKRICNTCKKDENVILKCSNCMKVYYCNEKCQLEDWNEHKKQCK